MRDLPKELEELEELEVGKVFGVCIGAVSLMGIIYLSIMASLVILSSAQGFRKHTVSPVASSKWEGDSAFSSAAGTRAHFPTKWKKTLI